MCLRTMAPFLVSTSPLSLLCRGRLLVCSISSLRAARGTATTTGWWKPRMAPSCASTWATATSPASTPRPSMTSIAQHLNPYLNYHRPCAQADLEVDEKGRQRRYYRRYQTPLETLLALPHAAQCLREGLSLATLERIAAVRSDTEAAQQMQQAKRQLFQQFQPTALGRWK